MSETTRVAEGVSVGHAVDVVPLAEDVALALEATMAEEDWASSELWIDERTEESTHDTSEDAYPLKEFAKTFLRVYNETWSTDNW